MSSPLRSFLDTNLDKAVVVVVALGCLGLMYVNLRGAFGGSPLSANSYTRLFVCAETGEAFQHTLTMGESVPVVSPHSGKPTGYEAELCFWTADGGSKAEPTAVLMNGYVGKPGATFCPDCDRRVVELNPAPAPGVSPPPTRAEHKAGKRPAASETDETGEE